MFQVQHKGHSGWSMVVSDHEENSSLEFLQKMWARHKFDKSKESYRILDLDTLKVHPVVEENPDIEVLIRVRVPTRIIWNRPIFHASVTFSNEAGVTGGYQDLEVINLPFEVKPSLGRQGEVG